MPDASFDAVIVGGGHNGLALGGYLAKNGMSVGVFERRHELGGGAATEELPLPGFTANTHAHFIRFWQSPAYVDLRLAEKGVKLVFPHANMSFIFDDARCIVSYPLYEFNDETGKLKYVPENREKTARDIARFSEKDAETALRFSELYHTRWRDAAMREGLNPPVRPGESDPIDEILADPNGGFDPRYQFMTVAQIASDLYESPQMQTYFMRVANASSGLHPGDVFPASLAIQCIGVMVGGVPVSISVGGTHNIAHALQRVLLEQGGKYHTLSEVDKVIVENGAAKGIKLDDGTEIEAKKLVISNIDVFQTILRLIGDHVSDDIKRKVKALRSDRSNTYWAHFALHELPRYRATAFNPDALTQRCYVGPAKPEYLAERHQAELFAGIIPRYMYFHPGHDTAFVSRHAPGGKPLVLVEQYAPPASYLTEREWIQMKKDVVKELVRQWSWYADNMTWDNIIGVHCSSPYDAQQRDKCMVEGCGGHIAPYPSQWGRFRPIPELARYRTPVKNLYMASASMHPASGVRALPAYNCYKILVEDFGLEKVWEKAGREY